MKQHVCIFIIFFFTNSLYGMKVVTSHEEGINYLDTVAQNGYAALEKEPQDVILAKQEFRKGYKGYTYHDTATKTSHTIRCPYSGYYLGLLKLNELSNDSDAAFKIKQGKNIIKIFEKTQKAASTDHHEKVILEGIDVVMSQVFLKTHNPDAADMCLKKLCTLIDSQDFSRFLSFYFPFIQALAHKDLYEKYHKDIYALVQKFDIPGKKNNLQTQVLTTWYRLKTFQEQTYPERTKELNLLKIMSSVYEKCTEDSQEKEYYTALTKYAQEELCKEKVREGITLLQAHQWKELIEYSLKTDCNNFIQEAYSECKEDLISFITYIINKNNEGLDKELNKKCQQLIHTYIDHPALKNEWTLNALYLITHGKNSELAKLLQDKLLLLDIKSQENFLENIFGKLDRNYFAHLTYFYQYLNGQASYKTAQDMHAVFLANLIHIIIQKRQDQDSEYILKCLQEKNYQSILDIFLEYYSYNFQDINQPLIEYFILEMASSPELLPHIKPLLTYIKNKLKSPEKIVCACILAGIYSIRQLQSEKYYDYGFKNAADDELHYAEITAQENYPYATFCARFYAGDIYGRESYKDIKKAQHYFNKSLQLLKKHSTKLDGSWDSEKYKTGLEIISVLGNYKATAALLEHTITQSPCNLTYAFQLFETLASHDYDIQEHHENILRYCSKCAITATLTDQRRHFFGKIALFLQTRRMQGTYNAALVMLHLEILKEATHETLALAIRYVELALLLFNSGYTLSPDIQAEINALHKALDRFPAGEEKDKLTTELTIILDRYPRTNDYQECLDLCARELERVESSPNFFFAYLDRALYLYTFGIKRDDTLPKQLKTLKDNVLKKYPGIPRKNLEQEFDAQLKKYFPKN